MQRDPFQPRPIVHQFARRPPTAPVALEESRARACRRSAGHRAKWLPDFHPGHPLRSCEPESDRLSPAPSRRPGLLCSLAGAFLRFARSAAKVRETAETAKAGAGRSAGKECSRAAGPVARSAHSQRTRLVDEGLRVALPFHLLSNCLLLRDSRRRSKIQIP